VQLGTDKIHVGPDSLVHIPAGTPHFAANNGDVEVLQLELLLPTHIPARAGKLVPLMEPRAVAFRTC
jgi:mannose-6-phosphate isomerase-like protein (cupin superfamily)